MALADGTAISPCLAPPEPPSEASATEGTNAAPMRAAGRLLLSLAPGDPVARALRGVIAVVRDQEAELVRLRGVERAALAVVLRGEASVREMEAAAFRRGAAAMREAAAVSLRGVVNAAHPECPICEDFEDAARTVEATPLPEVPL